MKYTLVGLDLHLIDKGSRGVIDTFGGIIPNQTINTDDQRTLEEIKVYFDNALVTIARGTSVSINGNEVTIIIQDLSNIRHISYNYISKSVNNYRNQGRNERKEHKQNTRKGRRQRKEHKERKERKERKQNTRKGGKL